MTHPAEARNGSSSASQQAASSNTPSLNRSDSCEIKRGGLITSVCCTPSGQWAWQLTDMIAGGSGYDTEGQANCAARAALVGHLTDRMVAALARRNIPSSKPQPKRRDLDTLAQTISDIDAIVQSEAESLSATAKLARRAVIAARTQANGSIQDLLGDLAKMLATLSYQAGDLSNTVNGEAEAVGCNHVRDWDEGQP